MLKKSKEIVLSGVSSIDGQPMVNLSARLGTEGGENTNVSQFVVDQELYKSNLKEARKDMDDFRDAVYDLEDQLAAESTNTKTTKGDK